MKCLPKGYKIINGEIVINTKEAIIIKKLCENYLNGFSFQESAKRVGIDLSIPSIKNIIFNEKYEGNSDYPAIYDEGTIEKLKAERAKRNAKRNIKQKAKIKEEIKIYDRFVLLPYEIYLNSPKEQAEYIYSRIEGDYSG